MTEQFDTEPRIIAWEPSEHTIERSRLRGPMDRMRVPRLQELHAEVARDPESYWRHVLADLDLERYRPFEQAWDLASGGAWPVTRRVT